MGYNKEKATPPSEADIREVMKMAENKMPEGGNEVEVYLLQDENGQEYEFEVIAKCEKNGTTYFAMIPAEESEMDGEFCEYVILKEIEEDGETTLVEVDDDKEFQEMADIFDDLFDEEIDYDAEAPKK